ncbi:hypothetical protein [Pseudomonas baetica]|nr:hypothetical protein [Pseudomonas baetica]
MAEHSDDDKAPSMPQEGEEGVLKLEIMQFHEPNRGRIFPLGEEFVGPTVSIPISMYKWHFKHGDDSYNEIERNATSNPVRYQAPVNLRHGQHEIHHCYKALSLNLWTPWYRTGEFFVIKPPEHGYGNLIHSLIRLPLLDGTGHPGATVRLYKEDRVTPVSAEGEVSTTGKWQLSVISPGLQQGLNTLVVKEAMPGWLGEVFSRAIKIKYYLTPTITKPGVNQIVPGRGIDFEGNCTPGMLIAVVDGNDQNFAYTEGKFFDTTHWKLTLKSDMDLPSGPRTVQTMFRLPDLTYGLGPKITFIVKNLSDPPRVPDINSPDILSIQNQKFPAWGYGGVAGAKVKCFLDGENIPRGETTARDNFWQADIELPPGTRSLVVEQTLNGMASGRSIPRAFRIRPPKVETATFDTPTDNKVVSFSGLGYTGASVEIRITSGPAGASPPRIVEVVGGEWKTTAPNWPYGTYKLEVIQKVPDNASRWIESEPLPLTVDHVLPDVSAVEVIADYQPIFSGQGYTGATVKLFNADGVTPIAPEVKVYEGKWKTTATDVWGPTLNRKVYIKQYLNGQSSAKWIDVPVTIAPRAPEVTEVLEYELSPKIIGTGWPGAILTLVYNVDGIFHKPPNNNGRWEFKRTLPFEPGLTHRFTVIQHYAGQTSSPASGTFVVYRPMVQPRITYPGPNAKVGRDVTVSGDGGMKGATMQLRNVRSGRDLGPPVVLITDGAWSIKVVGLVFDLHTIDAQQTLDGRLSARSQPVAFDVVLLPPEITVPEQNDTRERTSLVRGTGIPFGNVELWLAGMTSPWHTNIDVRANGDWEMHVSLPVGNKTLWARQTFVLDGKTHESQNTEPVTYAVVPAAPFIESPAADEHVGRRMVVSGFGVVGDTVMATLGAAMGNDEVKPDRTWSITLDADQIGGVRDLVVVSTCSDFESAPAKQTVVQGTYLPTLSRPEAGRRVANPVQFAGQGRAGIGEVRSWYDPDLKWVSQVIVTDGAWHATATQSLPGNGCWCWFRQTLTDDANGETVSDWVLSNRFEVDLTGEKKT